MARHGQSSSPLLQRPRCSRIAKHLVVFGSGAKLNVTLFTTMMRPPLTPTKFPTASVPTGQLAYITDNDRDAEALENALFDVRVIFVRRTENPRPDQLRSV